MSYPEIIEHPSFPLVDMLDANIPVAKDVLRRPLELDRRSTHAAKQSTLYEIGNRTLLTIAGRELSGIDKAAFSYGLKAFEVLATTFEPKGSIMEHDSANATRPISIVGEELVYDFDSTLNSMRERFLENMPKFADILGQNALTLYGDSANYMISSAATMRYLEVRARNQFFKRQGRPVIDPISKLQ